MLLTVAISTANDRLRNIQLPDNYGGCKFLVIQQIYDVSLDNVNYSGVLSRNDVDHHILNYAGLSKSRNFGIAHATTKYLFIMDDDVAFDVERMQTLIEWMGQNNVDVATCQHKYESGNFAKNYQPQPFRHNIFSLAKVSSIDICLNLEKVREYRLNFDERFGLGSDFPSGEEYIFLADCLKSGLNVWFYPITVGVHPDITSGMDFYTSPAKTLAKREMLKRIFGWKSPLFIFAFWLKKLPHVFKAGYLTSFTKNMLVGSKLD